VREPVYGAPAVWVAPDERRTRPRRDDRRHADGGAGHPSSRGPQAQLPAADDPAKPARPARRDDAGLRPRPRRGQQAASRRTRPDRVPTDILLGCSGSCSRSACRSGTCPLILEAVAEARVPGATPEQITEHVRQRLGFQIFAELRREDGTVPLIQLAPEWEETFRVPSARRGRRARRRGAAARALQPPRLGHGRPDRGGRGGRHQPGVVTTVQRRRFLRTVDGDARGSPTRSCPTRRSASTRAPRSSGRWPHDRSAGRTAGLRFGAESDGRPSSSSCGSGPPWPSCPPSANRASRYGSSSPHAGFTAVVAPAVGRRPGVALATAAD
jgi:hypothetical protein